MMVTLTFALWPLQLKSGIENSKLHDFCEWSRCWGLKFISCLFVFHSCQTYLESSWPRRSCGPAPCRPCLWARSSWWLRCRVDWASGGSTASGARPPEAGRVSGQSAVQPNKHICYQDISYNFNFGFCTIRTGSKISGTCSGASPGTADFPPAPPVPLLLCCFLLSWGGAVLCCTSLELFSLPPVPEVRLSRRITRIRSLRTPSGTEHNRK